MASYVDLTTTIDMEFYTGAFYGGCIILSSKYREWCFAGHSSLKIF